MRAIVINPAIRSIEEVNISGELESLQKIVDGYIEGATRLPNNDVLFVNEEGLFGENHYFSIGAHQPFAGSGVIVGMTDAGETTDAKTSLEHVKAAVLFLATSPPA